MLPFLVLCPILRQMRKEDNRGVKVRGGRRFGKGPLLNHLG